MKPRRRPLASVPTSVRRIVASRYAGLIGDGLVARAVPLPRSYGNAVGTFGVSSAAYWWVLRVISFLWNLQLVYVDDLRIVTSGPDKFTTLWMILLAYEVLGTRSPTTSLQEVWWSTSSAITFHSQDGKLASL